MSPTAVLVAALAIAAPGAPAAAETGGGGAALAGARPLAGDTVAVVVADATTEPGGTVTLEVTVDLTAVDGAIGAYQGRIRFDPEALTFQEAGKGTFDGSVVFNDDRARAGEVAFAGVSPYPERNRGRTTVLELTFIVRGEAGSAAPVGVELDELVTAGDFRILTSRVRVRQGRVLVTGPVASPHATTEEDHP